MAHQARQPAAGSEGSAVFSSGGDENKEEHLTTVPFAMSKILAVADIHISAPVRN